MQNCTEFFGSYTKPGFECIVYFDNRLYERFCDDFCALSKTVPHGREIPMPMEAFFQSFDRLFQFQPSISGRVVINEDFIRRYFIGFHIDYKRTDGETNFAGEQMLKTIHETYYYEKCLFDKFDLEYYCGGKTDV